MQRIKDFLQDLNNVNYGKARAERLRANNFAGQFKRTAVESFRHPFHKGSFKAIEGGGITWPNVFDIMVMCTRC